MMQELHARRVHWRRARNLRRGNTKRGLPLGAIAAGGLLLAGAALIGAHARSLGAAASRADAPLPASVLALQPALPGLAFSVPAQPGVSLSAHAGGALLIASGMRAEAPVRLAMCAPGAPLQIGVQFNEVARQAGPDSVLRSVALAAPGAPAMPRLMVRGSDVRWDGRAGAAHWISDASGGRIAQGTGKLGREGWLVWSSGALQLRRGVDACADVQVQLYRKGEAGGRARVIAFPASGAPVSAWLAAGSYQVPALARASLEDQTLFMALQQRGLVRLAPSGLIELAPPDLAAWQRAPDGARAADLAPWRAVRMDEDAVKLLARLHRMADGAYVREQVQVFNGERRLLAWRTRPGQAAWTAQLDAAPVATSAAMPPAAAALFDDLPQGWAPWTRVAAWPGAGASARLTLALAAPARAGATVQLLLAGRVLSVQGAQLRAAAACSGRACPAPSAVQHLTLALQEGATTVSVQAAPVDLAGMAGDARYRHLRVAGAGLVWQPLAAGGAAPSAAPAAVRLEDRHGTTLWQGGAPTAAARAAGLAGMLGLHAEHGNSVAGMLARLPSATPHNARLTLDLAWQAASQAALDCIGLRQGQWNGHACTGAQAVPPGRKAGLVILDTQTGDVLAAAGSSAADGASWSEMRDFDRANPARSPLRLPALQHDGGAHHSPGSTFKVISALGLELAAQRDPQLDALLGGMPLAAINRMASTRGFAFQTGAPSYPSDTRRAHITNYREQLLDRRAQDGRLGLAQALTYSLNTWFAWSGELSDRSLFGRAEGGAPDLQPLQADALDSVRPIVAMAHRLGFEQPLRLDGGLLPDDFAWSAWDALQSSPAHIDPVHTRHELRQMAIGLRMQVTPLHMALAAGAVGQGKVISPRLLLALDGRNAAAPAQAPLGVRVDRIRAGMKGVVDSGTAAGVFRGEALRRGLSGKTGTSPAMVRGADGVQREVATVWFTGWLEPGSLPGQTRRLALAAFVSHSDGTGGSHAAPVVAAVLDTMTKTR